MMCQPCTVPGHTEADCRYSANCPCQHKPIAAPAVTLAAIAPTDCQVDDKPQEPARP